MFCFEHLFFWGINTIYWFDSRCMNMRLNLTLRSSPWLNTLHKAQQCNDHKVFVAFSPIMLPLLPLAKLAAQLFSWQTYHICPNRNIGASGNDFLEVCAGISDLCPFPGVCGADDKERGWERDSGRSEAGLQGLWQRWERICLNLRNQVCLVQVSYKLVWRTNFGFICNISRIGVNFSDDELQEMVQVSYTWAQLEPKIVAKKHIE